MASDLFPPPMLPAKLPQCRWQCDSVLRRSGNGFALSNDSTLTHLIECKLGDTKPHRGLIRFAAGFPEAEAVQIVYDLRQEESRNQHEQEHVLFASQRVRIQA